MYSMVRFGKVWFGMVWYHMLYYVMVKCGANITSGASNTAQCPGEEKSGFTPDLPLEPCLERLEMKDVIM